MDGPYHIHNTEISGLFNNFHLKTEYKSTITFQLFHSIGYYFPNFMNSWFIELSFNVLFMNRKHPQKYDDLEK